MMNRLFRRRRERAERNEALLRSSRGVRQARRGRGWPSFLRASGRLSRWGLDDASPARPAPPQEHLPPAGMPDYSMLRPTRRVFSPPDSDWGDSGTLAPTTNLDQSSHQSSSNPARSSRQDSPRPSFEAAPPRRASALEIPRPRTPDGSPGRSPVTRQSREESNVTSDVFQSPTLEYDACGRWAARAAPYVPRPSLDIPRPPPDERRAAQLEAMQRAAAALMASQQAAGTQEEAPAAPQEEKTKSEDEQAQKTESSTESRYSDCWGAYMLTRTLSHWPSVSKYVASIKWKERRNVDEARVHAAVLDDLILELGLETTKQRESTEAMVRRIEALRTGDQSGNWEIARLDSDKLMMTSKTSVQP